MTLFELAVLLTHTGVLGRVHRMAPLELTVLLLQLGDLGSVLCTSRSSIAFAPRSLTDSVPWSSFNSRARRSFFVELDELREVSVRSDAS